MTCDRSVFFYGYSTNKTDKLRGGQFYWWSTRKKPPTCRKSLTIFITKCCIDYASPWTGFELTTLVMIGIDCIGSSKSNYHTITIIGLKTLINVIYMRRKGSWLSSEVEYFTNKFHGCRVFYTMNRGIQHFVIKIVSDLRQVGGFFRVLHQ
jgi:hypothetical protein